MDPNTTHPEHSRFGGVGPTNHSAEFGTVVAVDPVNYAYRVRTSRGRNLPGMPRKRYSHADLAVLPVGTTVIVRFDLGLPYIDGVLDLPAVPSTETGIPTTSAPALDNTTPGLGSSSFRGAGEPSDLLAGDSVTANASGVRVGALAGGIALLRASGMSQVIAHQLNDLVQIISRNYHHITDMGITKIENKDGRVNMSFRGASDQINESGAGEENWTIRMDLGSEGDLFNFELTTPLGQTLFRLHVDSDGRCEIFGLDGVVLQSGNRNGEPQVTEAGGDTRGTVHGNREETTGGDLTEEVRGTHRSTVDGDVSTVCGNDMATAAVRDVGISAGRNVTLSASGDKQGNPALTISALGGDYNTIIGANTYPTPQYSLQTFRGDINLKSTMGGKINLETSRGEIRGKSRKVIFDTTAANSVVLGGNALVAHATRFEQLETLVRAMFNHFDTHTHTASGGPTSVPLLLMNALLASLIAPCKSQRVGFGG